MTPSDPQGPDEGEPRPTTGRTPFPVRAMRDRSGPHPVVPPTGRRGGWLALASVILLAATIVLGIALARERRAHAHDAQSLSDEVRTLQGRVEVAEEDADDRQEAIEALSAPQLAVIELAAPGSRETKGRVFWDRGAGTWTLFAQDLAAPANGRTYQLWLVARGGQRINAGAFDPDESGHALVRASYDLEPGRLAGVEVTDEPEGGSPQPTGAAVLASSQLPVPGPASAR